MVVQAKEGVGVKSIPLLLFDEIKPDLQSHSLIVGLLPEGGITVLFGQPGSGKSFVALDISLHIARGSEWFGRKVQPGGVVYIAAEGQGGLKKRIAAWRKEFQPPADIPFALVPVPLDLRNPEADLPALVLSISERTQEWNGVALIVIDTLAKTFGGGDENSTDMAAYVANVEELAYRFNSAILLVHHQPVSGDLKRPRGHGSLTAAADTVLHVEGRSVVDAVRTIRVQKQKDDDPGDDILFRLQPVSIGVDMEGVQISSCIVEPINDKPMISESPKSIAKRKLPDQCRFILNALEKAIAQKGQEPPVEIHASVISPMVTKVLPENIAFDFVMSVLQTGSDIKPDSLRKAYRRAIDRLQAIDIISSYKGFLWLNP